MPPAVEVDVVPDSTDSGTHRSALPQERAFGTYFEPMICPKFNYEINIAPNQSAFEIWSTFFKYSSLKSLFRTRISKAAVGLAGTKTQMLGNGKTHMLEKYIPILLS
jgi:hypothetical protein